MQVTETRRAFYAGASALFALLTNGLSDGDEPQPADEARMGSLHDELVAFADDVRDGRA